MMLPGRDVLVTMTDGDSVRGTTRWCWRWLRLREVYAKPGSATPDVLGTLLIAPHAVLTVQVIPKGAS